MEKKKRKKTSAAGKGRKRESKASLKSRIRTFLSIITDEQQLAEMTYGRASRKMLNFVKIFIASGRKFIEDDCPTRSTAITYSALISLIPTLTVALTFASIFLGVGAQKDELFLELTKILAEHNLQRLNVTPILDAISGLLDNAASIGGIGAAVMIFSATAVLRTIEKSLNRIWKVTRQRPMVLKIVYYWAALTLGPLMLIAGTTLATQLSSTLSPPDYHDIHVQENFTWVAGSKAAAGKIHSADEKLQNINIERIDFDNQYVFKYDTETETMNRDIDSPVNNHTYSKTTFLDIEKTNATIRIAGEKGILLTSTDNGYSWEITKIDTFDLHDLHMFSPERGIIACNRGMILTTEDGGVTWQPHPIPGLTHTLHSIAFTGERGFITADKGYIVTTQDGGTSWTPRQLSAAQGKKYFASLNDIAIRGRRVLITGDDGLVLLSDNLGAEFEPKYLKLDTYTAGYIESGNSFYIGSDNGKLLHTEDGGISWDLIINSGQEIQTIYKDENTIMLAGNSGMFLKSTDNGTSWSGKSGKSAGYYLLNFFAPFVVIWLLFLLMYVAIPNVRVPLIPAALGASFTGAVWVAFIFIFVFYIKAFANGTFAIYGALAAFPLFLIMIYASTVIILFGAELAYTISHPASYRHFKKKRKIHDYTSVINGTKILYHVYKKFESGKGGSTLNEILKLTGYRAEETDFFLEQFLEHSLLLYKENCYLPAASSQNIPIASIITTIHTFNIDSMPPGNDPVKRMIGKKFMQIGDAVREILRDDTLYDLIEGKIEPN